MLQLYPETPAQMELITSAALRAGFTGGVLVDYPNSAKAKKFYLVLSAGQSRAPAPRALDHAQQGMGTARGGGGTARFEDAPGRGSGHGGRGRRGAKGGRAAKKSKTWVLNKKERQRKQGKVVRPHSKFTGRKRPARF